MRHQLPGEKGILESRSVPARVDRKDRARRDVVLPLTSALQRYADRGVFRGFRAEHGRGGRVSYQFTWLTRVPTRIVFDPARKTMTFASLFPAVESRSPIARDLARVVAERSTRSVPLHKRLDPRRARAVSRLRGGALSVTVTVRGANQEYAAQQALNLVNDLFLLLHEQYPDYLIEHFGLSPE